MTIWHNREDEANAKACPWEYNPSALHVSISFGLLIEAPTEKPVESALVIGDSTVQHVKLVSKQALVNQ